MQFDTKCGKTYFGGWGRSAVRGPASLAVINSLVMRGCGVGVRIQTLCQTFSCSFSDPKCTAVLGGVGREESAKERRGEGREGKRERERCGEHDKRFENFDSI